MELCVGGSLSDIIDTLDDGKSPIFSTQQIGYVMTKVLSAID
jgi:hypothetical protein